MSFVSNRSSFTLLELLVVLGILAVISVAVVLIINPSNLLMRSRDSKRVSELQSLNKALGLFAIDLPGATMGEANTVYVSIPSDQSDCSDLGLPTLPLTYAYHCVSEANLRKTDGNGWIPVNFNSLSYGSVFSTLPVDPVNTATNSLYYAYTTAGGSYEVTANMESNEYSLGGSKDAVSNDGGDNFISLELGNNLALNPYSFEFNNFAPSLLSSGGKGGWYNFEGNGTLQIQGVDGEKYLNFNGYKRIIWQQNIPFDPNLTYEISCRVRQVTDPSTGGKAIYCGWLGIGGDGITLVNRDGAAQYGTQFYHAAGGVSLNAGTGYSIFTGYTKGYGNPNGATGPCASIASPCKVHSSVRYIRPYFFLNYSSGNGIADIDYLRVRIIRQ